MYVTDGTNRIFLINPTGFSIEKRLNIIFNNQPLSRLNELEWVEGKIWANLWYSHYIAIIDPNLGEVEAFIDLRGIESSNDNSNNARGNVLNGIGYYNGKIFVTGKNWRSIYQIELTGPTKEEIINLF